MAQNIIFDSLIQVLNKYKQGQHKGVRWLGCMNTKEDVEVVKKFLDLGMQIRHTKDIPKHREDYNLSSYKLRKIHLFLLIILV